MPNCSDIEKIHDGIGDKLAILIQWVATFFAGFAIGFSQEWRLTLFMLGVTPFIAILTTIFAKVSEGSILCAGCMHMCCVCMCSADKV